MGASLHGEERMRIRQELAVHGGTQPRHPVTIKQDPLKLLRVLLQATHAKLQNLKSKQSWGTAVGRLAQSPIPNLQPY